MSDHDDGFILFLAKSLNSNIIFVALVWSGALVGSSNKIIGAEDKNARAILGAVFHRLKVKLHLHLNLLLVGP